MKAQDLAKEIANEIFKEYQLGMGTTSHPVTIHPSEKPDLIRVIASVLQTKGKIK